MNTNFKTFVAVGVAAIGLAHLAAPSLVLAQDEVRQEYVDYRDLNLQTEEGVATLDARLKRAIKMVCKARGHTLYEILAERDCQRATQASVSPQREFAINQANGSVELAAGEPGTNRQTRIRLAMAE
ncbi:UrcA family protein [Aurantiacibacter poecillastricola]|uniref:UrcA family protein n=1 Tax=Aurantiacibacter poecillastricola TaxID=3064385 RepID=UPI00273F1885|nr:UrcA family protein [Aurantiacibacter sp. 219JJ12-13]MDP5261353.1 UrcA family protein [Aurantiacibacter sp. 219JJ12-13]